MFKKGDKIQRIAESYGIAKQGEVYEVQSVNVAVVRLVGDSVYKYDPTAFKLFTSTFDMKKECWFIKIESEAQYCLVEDWLKENFGSSLDIEYNNYINYLSNTEDTARVPSNRVMWSRNRKDISPAAKEIVFSFKTEVDKITYPVVESATQKKIRELEESATKLQEQIAELKKLEGK